MPTQRDPAWWRAAADQAAAIADAARDDPYDPAPAAAMQQLAADLAAASGAMGPAPTLEDSERAAVAAAHLAAGEAWFALNRSDPALAEFSSALALLQSAPASGEGMQAWTEVNLARALVGLGRCSQALPLLEAAIRRYDQASSAAEPTHQARQAQAWHTLGLAHADLGDHDGARAATGHAVELRRRLAAHDAAGHQWDLSRSLNNLANWLGSLGQRERALEAVAEAVTLRRDAWQRRRSAAAASLLAGGLNNLGNSLDDVGRRAEALQAAQEAVELYRELAAGNRQAFLGDLAMSLNNLGNRLDDVGRRAEALHAAQEAVELRR